MQSLNTNQSEEEKHYIKETKHKMTPRRKRYKNGTKCQTEQNRGTNARPDLTDAAREELRGKPIDTKQ